MPEEILPLPVIGRITSGFGYRKPPRDGASVLHNGIDIAAQIGTPVYAPMDGVVLQVRINDLKAGNFLRIKHRFQYETGYLHLKQILVTTGSVISKGQIIAYTGNTGNVTGPHLHYYLKVNGQFVDPLKY